MGACARSRPCAGRPCTAGPGPRPSRAHPGRGARSSGGDLRMDSIALVARLKDGAEPHARALLADGPPFDPAEHGFSHHAVYLSATEVVFVYRGQGVEWSVDDLVSDP